MNIGRYIGLPYADRGRGPAYDCFGLVKHFYKEELGLDVADHLSAYTSSSDSESVSKAINTYKSEWVKVDKPSQYDILLFNIMGFPTHVGIYLNSSDFLHSFQGTNSCIERFNSVTWNRRLQGIYQWKG
jgi:cell wall-associated NlpC family hydrolase